MTIKNKIRLFMSDIFDFILISHSKSSQIKKFKDKRRIEIYTKVSLTKDQKKVIDDFYITHYGKKIPYTWHRHYTAFTGNFDKLYFPELLYIPEFERFMNCNNEGHIKAFEDKNTLPLLAKSAGVCMPETVFSSINGAIQDKQHNIVSIESVLSTSGEYFIKPTVDTNSGKGCQVVNNEGGKDILSGEAMKKIVYSKGSNWVMQKKIKCHSSITTIYPKSVNTFRIMTYIWKGEICHAPVIMRIGQGGSYLDNAHAGGMFIGISDDGVLHSTAFTEFKQEFTEHPDTHFIFKDYKIDLFPEVLKAAIRCHSFIPQLGCINWDFTIDCNGNPILIEANLRGGSIWLFEMAHGCSAFGEKTSEILQWLKIMKRTRKSERYKYAFGETNGI